MEKVKKLCKIYYKHILIVLVVAILLIGGIIVKAKDNESISNIRIQYNSNNYICVYIEGEVNYPGKYMIHDGSNIKDLIREAQGTTNEAEIAYINLNKILIDQETIYIPKKDSIVNNSRINVNIASVNELTKLTGIGTEKAASIILYRTTNGPFNKLEDLLNVPGITNNILLNIKNEITLS